MKDFAFEFNDECDTCLETYPIVAVDNEKKSCSECIKKRLKEKGIDPNELDENTKRELDEIVEKIVKKIVKKNDEL